MLSQVSMQPQYSSGPAHNPFPQAPKKQNYGSALQTKKAEEMMSKQSPLETPNQILITFNNGGYALNNSSIIPSKSMESLKAVEQASKSIRRRENKMTYSLPQNKNVHPYFELAFTEISEMLSGKRPLDLKRAVFLTENAWVNGKLKYELYTAFIEEEANLIKLKMNQEGMSLDDNLSKNFMIHKFMKDTLSIVKSGAEQMITTFPKRYDFRDPFGRNDVSNLFVTKLMLSNSGQCKSMPLYYLILLESLGGSAYLSFSPGHSYIKCKDNRGKLFNIETTNGMITSDSWMLGSGFVKSEAIKGGIFLDTLNKKQVIANCLVDLAKYYKWKYKTLPNAISGIDDFHLKCVNEALKYHSNNIHGLLEKSNYYTALSMHVGKQLGYKELKDLYKNANTRDLYLQTTSLYALTDGLGYELIPQEAYAKWLESINDDLQEKENRKQYNRLSRIVTPIK